MDIERRKIWKSRLLLAGMHLQALPVLGLGAVYSRFRRKRHPEIFQEECIKNAFQDKMKRLDPGHPVRDRVEAWARFGGLRLSDVFIREGIGFQNAFVRSSGADTTVFFEGNPLALEQIGPPMLDYVIGHELTHAVREITRHEEEANYNIKALEWGGMFYTGALVAVTAAATTGMIGVTAAVSGCIAALTAYSASLFSGCIGIPMLQRMYERNEEHLADIGAVRFTDDVHGAMLANQFLLETGGSGTGPKDMFGGTHPSLRERKDVLCMVFNVTEKQRRAAEQFFVKSAANGNVGAITPEVRHGKYGYE